MSDIQVGDRVRWLTLGAYEFERHEGTVTEITGDIVRVKESDGYYREHKLFAVRRLDAQPATAQAGEEGVG